MLIGSLIRYKYAINNQDVVVDVETLERDKIKRTDAFFCISCERKLIPALGSKNRKHFRHLEEGECSPETYLHKLAKRIFLDVYQDCVNRLKPYTITLPEDHTCSYCMKDLGVSCNEKQEITHDLTKWFPFIKLEPRVDSFIPDLLLLRHKDEEKAEKIFIEIVVTHFSSWEKKSSGNRVIEISIQSENDISIIRSCSLAPTPQVNFYNFVQTKEADLHLNCDRKLCFFVVFKSQKSRLVWETASDMKSRIASGAYSFSKFMGQDGLASFPFQVEAAYRKGVNIKNCFLCRYHGRNFSQDDDRLPIFCKYKRRRHNSNEAVSCDAYFPDPKVFPSKNII